MSSILVLAGERSFDQFDPNNRLTLGKAGSTVSTLKVSRWLPSSYLFSRANTTDALSILFSIKRRDAKRILIQLNN